MLYHFMRAIATPAPLYCIMDMPQPHLKICHIIAGAPHGGAETFCLDTVTSLHKRGIAQVMISRPHPNYVRVLSELGIRHYRLAFKHWQKWLHRRRIKGIISREAPDIVHCWMARAAATVPSHTGVPVLGWFGGYYQLKNYRHADFYMGVTRDIVRHIGEASGQKSQVYLGHTFGTLAKSPPVTHADFGLPADMPLVLLLSRMHWKKGVDVLLAAAKRLPKVGFLLAGDGPDLGRYKKLADQLGVADRVCFAGWRDDRAALLKLAAVCVLPSRYEPFGTVIAEAWSAGVPLVATRAAGAKQYVTHGSDGLLCDIDDVAGLAANIQRAVSDKALRQRLIAGGKRTYATHFAREVVIDQLLANYRDMLCRYQQQERH